MGQWKLVSANKGPWELYDMDVDRTELNDLSKQMPDRVADMRKAWETWAQQAGILSGGKKKTKTTQP